MSKLLPFRHLLVIPHIQVQNANAISSPLTHGFPAMTAFLGLMWALERKTAAAGLDLQFNAVAVTVHHHEEQATSGGFVNTFHLTRNPVDKDGSTAAIVEEGRIHMEISLVFAVNSDALNDGTEETQAAISKQVTELLSQMRIAGGSVIPARHSSWRQSPYALTLSDDLQAREQVFCRLKMRLLPGFTLVERSDLLEQRLEQMQAEEPNASKLDAWLSLARINWRYQPPLEENKKGQWQHDRTDGWIVPIPIGYGALTDELPAGSVANARDPSIPFRFVESLYSTGQWLSPHRLQHVEQMLWYADSQPENGLYRCRNDYPDFITDNLFD